MKRGQKSRSVLEKVEAVMALHRAKNPGTQLSVSSLARQAGVSRANLYTSHSKLLAELQITRSKKNSHGRGARYAEVDKTRDENSELKRVNKALLLLNIELRQEIARLQRKLPKVQPRKIDI